MQEAEPLFRGSRILTVAAALVIVVAGLRAIKPIVLPFIIAVLLSVLCTPLVNWLLRRRVPRLFAVLAAVLSLIAVLLVMVFLVGGSIGAFTRSVPTYQQRLEKEVRKVSVWLEEKGVDTAELGWLQDLPNDAAGATPADVGPEDPGAPDPPAAGVQESRPLPSFFNLGALLDIVGTTLRSFAELMTMMLLIILMMIFILFESAGLPDKLRLVLGWREESLGRMSIARREIQRYLGIKTLISLATGLTIGLWVWLVGLDFPQLWGLLAFLLNYIPNIGSIISAVPAVSLALIDMGPGGALAVALGYLVTNTVLGNLIEPHLMGRQFGISTLVVFLSLVFWGWVWGPIGMLLSVPLTMVLKILLGHTQDLRWVALMIGPNPRPQSGV